ncbi:hypothetical protein FNV43_RR03399 [Rhamnella rubrinervis]|uniref:Uncharacterized protein n=1 Tax=Rhamnella rubrinervis TaxID=2594499 RepID=A0A8K0HIC1_9ROSA|nr:hypothetical protein FNV43_RR03399 [Rhamnella rubrinervis]
MEEDLSSTVSNGVNVMREASDSNCSTHSFPVSKRERSGSTISRRKFKGVVPQPNGNWGSQIYANHQRIWLGTFNSEKDAAMAYDSAAFKLRDGEYSQRNFPWTGATELEADFQRLYSTEAVINMIKNGTYQAKFADFLRNCPKREETNVGVNLARVQTKGVCFKQLFHKELTPSDVSKLNRLVIPRKYAVEYFPCICETSEEDLEDQWNGRANDVQLVFHDRMMSPWKFRYCYWSSSQSFVFTRGWNHFVKEKQLKANDTVSFYMCECKEVAKEAQTFYMIDVIRGENNGGANMIEAANHCVKMQFEMKFEDSQKITHHHHDDDDDKKRRRRKKKMKVEAFEDDVVMEAKPIIQEGGGTKSKCFRLFGVQINII